MEPENREGSLHPIDSFFRTLAKTAERKAACVILSGTGTDGTLGLKEINAHNGLCIAQSSETADYEGMPMSAVETGFVDYILAPESIPKAIVNYFSNSEVEQITEEADTPVLERIFNLLKRQTGHDFSFYKKNTILRRINRRISINDLKNEDEYLSLLKQKGEELDSLFAELLIGVTSFFREAEALDALKENVLPDMLKGKDSDDTIRVWVPGCSTGEEVYSLGIIFQEVIDGLGLHPNLQFFASDINYKAVEKARYGRYPASIEADVGPERLKRFFVREEDFYRIKREIRDQIVFSVQDILKDPPFTNIDFLSCRNLLIYLNSEAQKKLIPLFHYALKQHGLLMLGTSETIGRFSDIFETVEKSAKIFKKKPIKANEIYSVRFPISTPYKIREPAPAADKTAPSPVHQAEPRLKDYILSEVAPPAVLVEENGVIHYIAGNTGKYLMPPEGYPSHNILKMAREGLRPELSAALRQVKSKHEPIVRKQVRVKTNGENEYIDLLVKPVPKEKNLGGTLLVVFRERGKPDLTKGVEDITGRERELKQRIVELEKELQETRESRQVTVEELETSNEEVKSMNEELQSSNEELQSTNEELESSKEELQSLNEELTTVNSELQEKVDELSNAHDDMNNLLNSTNIATVFLDNELKIKRYTPAMEKISNIIQSDKGRPFHHVSDKLQYDHMKQDIEEVLDTLQSKEIEVASEEGRWYKMRVLPYLSNEKIIDGVVITFFDITEQKKNQEELRFALDFSNSIINTIREPLLILDGDLTVINANHNFYQIFKTKEQDTVGRHIYDLGNKQWDNPELRRLLETIIPESESFENFEIEHKFPRIGKKKMLLNARKVSQKETGTERILLVIEDVTPEQ
jgi:two-component system CheB/CheR fusion protein